MIRKHPDAVAIAIILLITGALGNFVPRIRIDPPWALPGLRHELELERQRIEQERDRFRMERDRFREELHRAFRFRNL